MLQSTLDYINNCKTTNGYKNVIITFDTETSKTTNVVDVKGHVQNVLVCYTMTITSAEDGQEIESMLFREATEMWSTLARIAQSGNIIVFAHNYAYDWQFTKAEMLDFGYEYVEGFFMAAHKPLYIRYSVNGSTIEFRDSYIMFNTSLDSVCKQYLPDSELAKTHDWDYSKMRTRKTQLSDLEQKYALNDTRSLGLAIYRYIELLKGKYPEFKRLNIVTVPRTSTGVPRCLTSAALGDLKVRKDRFRQIQPKSIAYQKVLKLTYRGGFTHANRYFVKEVIGDAKTHICCFDFSSSYPARMVMCKFPMSEPVKLSDAMSESELFTLIDGTKGNMGYIAYTVIENPECTMDDAHFMPYLGTDAKNCSIKGDCDYDNGRVASLKGTYEAYFTEVDLNIIRTTYKWSSIAFKAVYCYEMDYLPLGFRNLVMSLYQDKTNLKGGDAGEYGLAKAILNSLYGMCVQDPLKPTVDYVNGEFVETEMTSKDYEEWVDKCRVGLPFIWGVYITAYAREALYELGQLCEAWLYSDTDSIYCLLPHTEDINAYNDNIKAVMAEAGIEAVRNLKHPEDTKEYWLGVAEPDGEYMEFITLGSKRYACRKLNGEIKLTVAGVPKKNGAKCLKNDLHNFKDGLVFDGATTGKSTTIYIEGPNPCIDLVPCDYLLSSGIEGLMEFNKQLFSEINVDFTQHIINIINNMRRH